jgi:integrase/recombinase XerC
VVEAALVLLDRMGLTAADLAAAPPPGKQVPTFAEYVPVVSAAVSAGTRRAYGSYWNRVIEHWGARRLDEPTPSEIRQLMAYVKTHVVARRNARGGRSAEEHLVAALRCLYRRAVDDGLIAQADNPARKVAKPRRLPTTRRALPDTRLAEINEAAAATGDDPDLDTLLLRLHTETAGFSSEQFGYFGIALCFRSSATGQLRLAVQQVLCTCGAGCLSRIAWRG